MNTKTQQLGEHWFDALDMAHAHTGVFIALWSGLFLLLLGSLISVGLAPQALLDEETDTALAATVTPFEEESDEVPETLLVASGRDEDVPLPEAVGDGSDAPVRVVIDKIGVDTPVNNPRSTNMDVLNKSLESGAVHYPGSGNLRDTSNMFLFGHSSHLPVVRNQAYKAFNDLEDLVVGDEIRVESATEVFIYHVTSVTEVSAEDALVHLSTKEKKLTLSTCNNFGSKQDRFVVEADFVRVEAL